MFLKNLTLTGFKNYGEAKLDFSERINCLVGDNGVGKTNILDAIHYLSLTKSFFNSVDSNNIRHGDDFFIINGVFDLNSNEDAINCVVQRQKGKSVKRNGKEYQRFADHVGRFPVVMLSPADSSLITEGSEERRRFMNKIVSQFDNQYLDSILKYNKALQHRNKLLKAFNSGYPFESEELQVWDSQLERYGKIVFHQRKELVERMIPLFQHYYSIISSGKEVVKLSYVSHLLENSFMESLAASLSRDMAVEYTTIGVHKDDLSLEMGGFPIRSIGSQGQQKSYLTALKLAKYGYIKERSGVSPILLLDDIFDKFDGERVEQIIKIAMTDGFGQIFITDTHRERIQQILEKHGAVYRLFCIENNSIRVANA